ncbi:hypothetical protein [Hafnia paralvei]|jgi:hypothetical protein|uniref:hypothetical protein n=1 Tax=Hafnia paralvei TaxID=546367 RepID=UPI000580193A|nr:hypothetical protein [Hafnia paralvei]KHS50050.1 hypothetical protein RN38_03555 [Hafnia paralvei]TBL55338.1 hypothetical protein EYZ00_04760 [Hafnia paralvei]
MNLNNTAHQGQGILLPKILLSYGLTEDCFDKIQRAKNACALLDQLLSQYDQTSANLTPVSPLEVCSMVAYLHEDLRFVIGRCEEITLEVPCERQ